MKTFAVVVLAQALPFWGDGSPSTNRPPASSFNGETDCAVETRVVDLVSVTLDSFTSYPRGLYIICR